MASPEPPTKTALPLPLSLSRWIKEARLHLSKDDYILCAITVATRLTDCLLEPGLGNDGISFRNNGSTKDHDSNCPSALSSNLLLPLQIEDLVLENVFASCEYGANNDCISHVPSPHNYVPTDVAINQKSTKTDSELEDNFPDQYQFSHSQQDLCFALGKILFGLFSEEGLDLLEPISLKQNEVNDTKIEALRLDDCDRIDTNGGGGPPKLKRMSSFLSMSVDDVDISERSGDCANDASLPTLKRFFLSSETHKTTATTKSMKANGILQSQKVPLSLCRLVSDLLDAEVGNPYMSNEAMTSLEEVQHDLLRMKSNPERFLHENACPIKALEMAALSGQIDDDAELYGREDELRILMDAVARASGSRLPFATLSLTRKDLPREAVFLSGISGSGKSMIIKRIISHYNDKNWSVIFCKCDRQSSSLSKLLQSLDAYFGKLFDQMEVGRSMQDIFHRISQMFSFIDNQRFHQICLLIPKLGELFPTPSHAKSTCTIQDDALMGIINQTTSTTDSFRENTHSGRNSLLQLVHLIFTAVCRAGQPVLICIEDLQWVDKLTLDIVGEYIIKSVGDNSSMMLLGSFRDDEVSEDGFLINKIERLESSPKNVNVTRLKVDILPEHEINEMISFKLCLPMRYTRELAKLVFCKTRGHPLFLVQFLQSLVQKDLISFSIKSRRWKWDCDIIDMQMISDDVAEFLTKKLGQLQKNVITALKIAACIGYVNTSTIQLLDMGQFMPANCLLQSFESAAQEGVLEKAGPVFAFTHDMLQESSYDLVVKDERKSLHKKIGKNLVVPGVEENAELCMVAVDQVKFCMNEGGILDPSECSTFARLNLAAGKHAMSIRKLNYEQARGYLDTGISLLDANKWETQYLLCLELYEWSVVLDFIHGRVLTVSRRLVEILNNARSFDDALNSRVLMAKFLVTQEKYDEATSGVLSILTNLGEELPKGAITESLVISEINAFLPMLKGITKEKVLSLPPMTEKNKLYAMKFLDLLATFSFASSVLLMHVVGVRMVKLTFQYGFCDESIAGLVVASNAICHFSRDNILLATQISRIAASFMDGHHHEHSLKARLTRMITSVHFFVEPWQAVLERVLDGHHSAMIVGDIDTAMDCALIYGGSSLFSTDDLASRQKTLAHFVHQMAKHKRINALHSSMSYYDAYSALVGKKAMCPVDTGIQMKTNNELLKVAENTKNRLLGAQVILNRILVHCFLREYLQCGTLATKYEVKVEDLRSFDLFKAFYEGIAALNLARDTKQRKWREIGERSVKKMAQLVHYSVWNIENKHMLLQAELHYLDGRHTMAEHAYKSSIISARDHRFLGEEAMALELYGIYFLENKKVKNGIEKLKIASDKYKEWGALEKSEAVKHFMELVSKTKLGKAN